MFYLAGSLKTLRLKYVILDWTWRDQKLRRMIDIPEVGRSIQKLVKTRYREGENYSLNVSPSLGEGGGGGDKRKPDSPSFVTCNKRNVVCLTSKSDAL